MDDYIGHLDEKKGLKVLFRMNLPILHLADNRPLTLAAAADTDC